MGRRRGKRNRERKSRRIVFRTVWHFGGRPAVLVQIDRRGVVLWQVKGDPRRVGAVDREIAANLLGEFLPRLSHDERYALLWG